MKQTKKYIATSIKTMVVMLFFSAFFARCASILTPTGGPKDSLPPVIVLLDPDNYTTEFEAKKIYIEFDEFVQIKDQQKEFYTSPIMKSKPTIYTKGRGIVVTIKDTLLENTTYSLNFGSSIRDNNEGNPLNSMRYVFSTGKTIDSMILSGYTEDSYKADSVSKSFVYFFVADSLENVAEYDSTLFKYTPAAIARAENNGIFIAQNLKPIRYRAYAYEDTNGNQTYEPGTDQVGFLGYDFTPQELPRFAIWHDSIRQYVTADPQLYFRMFTDNAFKRHNLTDSKRPLQHQAVLYFSAPSPQIEAINFLSVPNDEVIIDPQGTYRDTVALWFKSPAEELPDTIRTVVSYYKHDSIRNLVLTHDTLKLSWRFIESREAEKERLKKEAERDAALARGEEWRDPDKVLKYKMPLSGEVNPERHLTIDFDYPLVKIDTSKLLITSMAADSTITDRKVIFERDTSLLRRYYIRSEWGEPTDKHTLTIPRGTFTDVTGVVNDSLVGSYSIADPEKLATVLVNFKAPDTTATRYTLQLLNGSSKLIEERHSLTSGHVQFNYVPVGDIRFRIIEDVNGNGRWDGGSILERRQPERSAIYDKDGESTFSTRANWEVVVDMDMSEIFAPMTMDLLVKTLDEREERRAEAQRIKDAEAAAKKAQEANKNSSSGTGFNMGGITSAF